MESSLKEWDKSLEKKQLTTPSFENKEKNDL